MRHYAARQLKIADLPTEDHWHMTCLYHNRIFPVGYCAGTPDYEQMAKSIHPGLVEEEKRRAEPFLSKFHTHTHATKEEAAECYKQYRLDLRARYDGCTPTRQEKCLECGEWTTGVVVLDGIESLRLCPQHANAETAAKPSAPAAQPAPQAVAPAPTTAAPARVQ